MSYRINSEISEGEGEEEEEREAAFYRLEGIGYRVGQGLVERFAKDRGKFGDALDVIKFVCKDLWGLVFRKQVDNLKTNHRVSFLFSVKWGGGCVMVGRGSRWVKGEGGCWIGIGTEMSGAFGQRCVLGKELDITEGLPGRGAT